MESPFSVVIDPFMLSPESAAPAVELAPSAQSAAANREHVRTPAHPAAAAVRERLSKTPPLAYGALQLPSRYLLSPLAGYTNLPFRRVVRSLGGLGLGTTDLVNARGLLAGSVKTIELTETCPEDRPFAVQIFGHEPSVMRDAAQLLAARGVDSIDINMGCPVNRVTKIGAGASLMCRVDPAIDLVRAVVEAVPLPVTVKMRLGWDDSQLTAPTFAREFEQVGVAAIAIHGRTRAQGFSGTVNRAGIAEVVAAVSRIPVVANGDVRTVDDAIGMLAETHAIAVSIGRGALANPWIFRQLVEWETTGAYTPVGSFHERMTLLRQQLAFVVEQRGPERAVSSFRKMAHWYTKAMRVPAALRHQLQIVGTLTEFHTVLAQISAHGPPRGHGDDVLPDFTIATPAGPNEHW